MPARRVGTPVQSDRLPAIVFGVGATGRASETMREPTFVSAPRIGVGTASGMIARALDATRATTAMVSAASRIFFRGRPPRSLPYTRAPAIPLVLRIQLRRDGPWNHQTARRAGAGLG